MHCRDADFQVEFLRYLQKGGSDLCLRTKRGELSFDGLRGETNNETIDCVYRIDPMAGNIADG